MPAPLAAAPPGVDTADTLLRVDDLKVHFPLDRNRVVHAVDGVSLGIRRGATFGVVGESGSGKTTLLRALAGRVMPTSGSIEINGHPVNERDPEFRRSVAVMIGLPPMASDLTVFDHVALVSSTWEETPGSVEAATCRVLDEFDLTALGARYPHELSSGQTQLFGLALVFVRPFEVLLLDEPEQRLDPGRVKLLARAMLARRAAGATIVAATHSSSLADRTADLAVTLGVQV